MKRGKARHTRATRRQLVSSLRTNPLTLVTPCVIEAWMLQNNTCCARLSSWFAERHAACKTRILHPLFLQRGIAYRRRCLGNHSIHPSHACNGPWSSLRNYFTTISAAPRLGLGSSYSRLPAYSSSVESYHLVGFRWALTSQQPPSNQNIRQPASLVDAVAGHRWK